jgi:hypothetical protein
MLRFASRRLLLRPSAVTSPIQPFLSFPARAFSSATRRPFIGGNWKCNLTTQEVTGLVSTLNAGKINKNADVVVAPPSIHAASVRSDLRDTIAVASQVCSS